MMVGGVSGSLGNLASASTPWREKWGEGASRGPDPSQRRVQVARGLGWMLRWAPDPSSDFFSLAHHLLSVTCVSSVSHSISTYRCLFVKSHKEPSF